MADRFGTRAVFSSAIGVFTLGSFLCGISTNIHFLVAARILQGMGGAMMMPVGRLTMVRTFAKSELVRAMTFVAIPGLVGPMLGPVIGGLIIRYFHWSVIFFVNIPIGLIGLYLIRRSLPDYHGLKRPMDLVGLILFGSGVALLSYVLEVFGEHTLGGREILGLLLLSLLLLAGYGLHTREIEFPLLDTGIFHVRTFRSAVLGSFWTRLGIGGVPFLFPLLYHVGLGFTPVQSGLLMMPQAIAAMSLKVTMPKILTRFGYRRVLIVNTIALGVMLALFATIGLGTPAWLIVAMVFCYGFLTSLQYSSMNTLAYADVPDAQASGASTIASTGQQMSMSFGVATASLATAIFIPDRASASPTQMVHGIHQAFLALGVLTILSTFLFRTLKNSDGEAVSRHKQALAEEQA
jgi:EmrB/QacA subfamily drug resistance transporter